MIDSEFRYAEDLEVYLEAYKLDQPSKGEPDLPLVEWRLAEKLLEIGANTQPDERFLEYLENQIQEVVRSPVDTIVQTDYRAFNIQSKRSFGRIPRFSQSKKSQLLWLPLAVSMSVVLLFAILIASLSGCAQAIRSEQLDNTLAPAGPVVTAVVTQAEATSKIEAKCVRNSEETQLLINFVQGYCLQYPIGYDISFPNEMEIMLMKGSVLNSEDPSLFIKVEPTDGMTVEQVADQLTADYSVPGLEVKRVPLEIDQEQAIMLDGLTGQDINRHVVVLHNDRLYHMTIMPMEGSPDVHAQAEALFNTVIQSFNFHPETNICPDCPPPSETPEDQIQDDPGSAMISGWVWHDQCDSGKDGQPAPASTPPGCVQEVSPMGSYHADGVLATDEPLIEGVVVTLGEGECPSTGMAERSTIITDLSYSFSSLKAGTYCVSIDSQREPNFSILRPGVWTYPAITQDVISTTVILAGGEYKGMVNFGWDFQFQP